MTSGEGDNDADEGNNLQIVPISTTNRAAVTFQINGLDNDITKIDVSSTAARR